MPFFQGIHHFRLWFIGPFPSSSFKVVYLNFSRSIVAITTPSAAMQNADEEKKGSKIFVHKIFRNS